MQVADYEAYVEVFVCYTNDDCAPKLTAKWRYDSVLYLFYILDENLPLTIERRAGGQFVYDTWLPPGLKEDNIKFYMSNSGQSYYWKYCTTCDMTPYVNSKLLPFIDADVFKELSTLQCISTFSDSPLKRSRDVYEF